MDKWNQGNGFFRSPTVGEYAWEVKDMRLFQRKESLDLGSMDKESINI